jgi:hypothetical protein
VPCTRLVITSGAWSPRVFNTLFPLSKSRIPVSSLAGHSLLVRNPHHKPDDDLNKEVCHAVFATDTLGFSPEWFARLGGELYLAGLNSTSIPLPDLATEVKASEKAIEQLKQCAKAMMKSVEGRDMEVLREGLVCCPLLGSYAGTYTDPNIVFPPSYIERPTLGIADTRREARRCRNERWRAWWCLHCCGPWCLGHIACTWYGVGALGIDRRAAA